MAQSSFPFETIDTTETQFSQMFRNFADGVNGAPSGTDVKVTAGGAMVSSIAAGQAMVRGHYYISTATETLTHATANPTNPRIDSVVLTLDPTVNSILLAIVQGTAAATPVAPTLTQTDGGVYQYKIADVAIAAAATSLGTITDQRTFMGSRFGVWSTAGRPASPITGRSGYNITLGYPEYWNGSAWNNFSTTPSSISSAIVTTAVSDKSANYTIASGDKNTFIRSTGSAITITLANVLAAGESIQFIQAGTGQITFAAGSGVTLTSADSYLKTAKQYAGVSVVCASAGVYHLIGNLGA
jgi:hypothetical protein